LLIAQNWDKAQQYTDEFKTDENYDIEIREALQGECDSCTQEGSFCLEIFVNNFIKFYKKYLFDCMFIIFCLYLLIFIYYSSFSFFVL